MERADRSGLHLHFHGRKDHLDPELREYRVRVGNLQFSELILQNSLQPSYMARTARLTALCGLCVLIDRKNAEQSRH